MERDLEKNIETLRGFGVENILLQREVFDADLFFKLLSIISVADLDRMPQYQFAPKKNQTAQLLTYPALMAHDIEGYQKVYVGEDQLSHICIARKMLNRYARVYGVEATCPEPVITTAKICDLRDSSKKMSKSHPEGCLFLDDSPDEIRTKVRRAVMDEAGEANMRVLYAEFVGEEMPTMFGEAKPKLADNLIERLHDRRYDIGSS